ncbi:hypothetical protein IC762_12355 [Bradyrhizobium genosp. L]|uniref:hypothetical protein n=1 Tax=Bradyrhizobium genosp. L TaxID=83637 RepID=UPI0018A2FC7D|nr:hypothetical protein [Bradyrhizobium genosp. L]QPF88440.1 hypothetical protein IC762_12355 [Bradyrhizobium genosp. L]
MPLIKGSSREAISQNIRTESKTKPHDQAVAIALDVARRARKADGGGVQGMVVPGNIDLASRPVVHNDDGTISTVRSIGINDGGKEVLIPTVSPDASILSNDDAVRLYRMTGKHLGMFDTPENSDAYAAKLHDDQAVMYQGRANGGRIKSALRIARKADGGSVYSGYIHGNTGGRTDNKDIDVASGSYIIPADILSGLGQGNSHAGAEALMRQLNMGPQDDAQPPMKADGGPVGAPVPIVAASGEMVIPPDKVAGLGGGDLDRGHSILDAMVSHVRKKTIKTLKSLPKPKKN